MSDAGICAFLDVKGGGMYHIKLRQLFLLPKTDPTPWIPLVGMGEDELMHAGVKNDCTAKSSTPTLRMKDIINLKMLQRTV